MKEGLIVRRRHHCHCRRRCLLGVAILFRASPRHDTLQVFVTHRVVLYIFIHFICTSNRPYMSSFFFFLPSFLSSPCLRHLIHRWCLLMVANGTASKTGWRKSMSCVLPTFLTSSSHFPPGSLYLAEALVGL